MASLIRMLFLASLYLGISAFDIQGSRLDASYTKAMAVRRWRRSTNTALYDLDKHVRDKLRLKYKDKNQELLWISTSDLDATGEIPKTALTVKVENAKKGTVSEPKEKISGLFSNLYCNAQDLPLNSSIHQLIKRNATFTYKANRGLKRFNQNNVIVELELPKNMEIAGKPVKPLSFNILGKKSDAETVTDELELKLNVTVQPKAAEAVNVTIIYKVVEMEYEADVVISGNLAAKYKDTDGKEKFETHNIGEFKDSNFVGRGDDLVFQTNGFFKASRAFEVKVAQSPVPITAQQCQHEELQSEGGTTVIHMQPPKKKEEDLTQK